ncbi:MAG: DegV family protein [Bacilli bacterium]|nr:DegV family protein [Bacilli bacterium]
MAKFAIVGDSTCDLTTDLRKDYEIEYARMLVSLGNTADSREIYADLDWKDLSAKEFYDQMRNGMRPKTAQVTEQEFDLVFIPHLEKGEDVLYLACSSALSASVKLAERLAVEKYAVQYPNARVIVVDTLCSCMGQGMMLIDASKMRAEGKTIDEVAAFFEENKLRYNQAATLETLDYLAKAGRVKAGKAFFGNLFGVKPMLISDAKGNNFASEKQKGRRNGLLRLVSMTAERIENASEQVVYLSHADAKAEDVELVRTKLLEEVGVKDVYVLSLGPIIGGVTGPGTVAVFCYGKKVDVVGE